MIDFKFPVIVTHDTTVFVKELPIGVYKPLLKHITNGNKQLTEQAFEDTLAFCVQDYNELRLNRIDKLLILLQLCSISIYPEITLNAGIGPIKCDVGVLYTKVLSQFSESVVTHAVTEVDNYQITLDIPFKLKLGDMDELIYSCVHSIYNKPNNILHTRHMYKEMAWKSVIDQFSIVLSNSIMQFVLRGKQHNITLVEADEDFQLPAIEINAFDDSLFELICILYKQNLADIYDIEYICAHKLKISITELHQMSLAEANIFLSKYKTEVEKQKEEYDKMSQRQGGMPNMPSMNIPKPPIG